MKQSPACCAWETRLGHSDESNRPYLNVALSPAVIWTMLPPVPHLQIAPKHFNHPLNPRYLRGIVYTTNFAIAPRRYHAPGILTEDYAN